MGWRAWRWRGGKRCELILRHQSIKCSSPSERQNNDSVYLLTKTTRAVPSASCRVHVELSWKTPRQRATLWAIIMPPPNEALADPSLPLYSALSLSLPLLSPPLSSTMDRSSDSSSRHHSVSLPGIRTLFPGIISGQHIFLFNQNSSAPH
jgi:hypothetical protein